MESYHVLILFSISSLIIGYAFFLFDRHKELMNQFIEDKFTKENLSIDSVSEFNLTEKVRYNVPVISYSNIISYTIPLIFMGATVSFFRKIELTCNNDNQHTKYVQITLNRTNVFELVEIDNFDF